MGPVISAASFDKITGALAKAKEEGAQVIYGGGADNSKGYFVDPTVLLFDKPDGYTMVNEIFGPVLSVSSNFTLSLLRIAVALTNSFSLLRSTSTKTPTMPRHAS